MKETMTQYIYQIFAREGTTEYAIQVNFNFALDCRTPLGDKFKKSQLPFDFSFIYGEIDWVRLYVDSDTSQECVNINSLKNGGISKYHIVPDATHNLHYNNPEALANTIINDLLHLDLPIRSLAE